MEVEERVVEGGGKGGGCRHKPSPKCLEGVVQQEGWLNVRRTDVAILTKAQHAQQQHGLVRSTAVLPVSSQLGEGGLVV